MVVEGKDAAGVTGLWTQPAVAAAPEDSRNSLIGQVRINADEKVTPAAGTIEWLQKYLLLAPNGPNAPAARDLISVLAVQENRKQ